MKELKAGEYLDSLLNNGINPGIDTIRCLLKELNNPQDHLKVVHIAGTNGKGSVAKFLSFILNEAKISYARYSSPAVFERNETISINDINISNEELLKYEYMIKEAADRAKVCPTEFEAETAIAFKYFYDNNPDIVLLECGMGGRNDATNVIKENLCSCITSISLEHQKYLGSTIEEIADAKAGIIKPSSAIFIPDSFNESVVNIIKKYAFLNDNYLFHVKPYKEIQFNAVYQYSNAGLAVDIAYYLRTKSYRISDENIKDGIKLFNFEGRFELLDNNPDIIIDGAHNPEAVSMLKTSLSIEYPDTKFRFIFGAFKDKSILQMLEIIAPITKMLICVKAFGSRAEEPEILNRYAIEKGIKSINMCSSLDALDYYHSQEDNTPIVCFGSLSYIHEIKEFIEGK